MTTILFVTWDGGGNVPPALGIAVELQGRGHAVRVIGHAGQAGKVTGSGLPFTAFATARPFSAERAASPLTVIRTFGDRSMGRDVLDELRRAPADVVVVDSMLVGVMAALDDTGTPYVVLQHLYDAFQTGGWLQGPIGLALRLKGLRPRTRLDHARPRLVATLPELDPAYGRGQSANVVYSGPVVEGTPAQPDQPTVLVSLSTYHYSGMTQVLQNVLDAVTGLPASVVVTTGPIIDPDDLRPAPNTEVHRWVPHAELMPQASLVIGHGGHATTMAALAHDLPLLILPMHPMLDQPIVGRSIEAAGAGRMLRKKSTPQQLRPVIEELLGDGPHRAAAARLGRLVREARGTSTAADLVEQSARTTPARR